jgi:hypothetical protein
LNCLSFQIVEREFRDLDEALIWVDRNQLGRRNLTDEQRTIVIGRLYKTVKQNPILNLKPFQKDNGDRVDNLSTLSGSAATAKAIAEQVGVNEKTVRRAEKFADAVEALQEVSPQAAERVLRGDKPSSHCVANGMPIAHCVGHHRAATKAKKLTKGVKCQPDKASTA